MRVRATGRRLAWSTGVRAVIALTALSWIGCVPPTTIVKRSAMVPYAAPIQRTGQPMGENLAELSLGTDTLAPTANPGEADPDAGVVIPRYQTDIAARVRSRYLDNIDFGLVYRRAFAEAATAADGESPNPGRDASVYGLSFAGSIATEDPRLRFGVAIELSVADLPFVVYESCVANCGGFPIRTIDEKSELVLGYAASFLPSWRLGRFTAYGGATLRNHPTIDKRDVRMSYVSDMEGPTSGPLVVIVSAGVEAELGSGVRGGLGVYQPAIGSPVAYAPTVSASLTIPLSREVRAP